MIRCSDSTRLCIQQAPDQIKEQIIVSETFNKKNVM